MAEFFEWQAFESGPISPSILARRGEEIQEKLSKRGIRIPEGNRLSRASKLVKEWTADKIVIEPQDTELQHKVVEAIYSLWDAWVVAYTLGARPRRNSP